MALPAIVWTGSQNQYNYRIVRTRDGNGEFKYFIERQVDDDAMNSKKWEIENVIPHLIVEALGKVSAEPEEDE